MFNSLPFCIMHQLKEPLFATSTAAYIAHTSTRCGGHLLGRRTIKRAWQGYNAVIMALEIRLATCTYCKWNYEVWPDISIQSDNGLSYPSWSWQCDNMFIDSDVGFSIKFSTGFTLLLDGNSESWPVHFKIFPPQ